MQGFATEAKAGEVAEYFAGHEWPGSERSVAQALEAIRVKAAWLTRDAASLEEYLRHEAREHIH